MKSFFCAACAAAMLAAAATIWFLFGFTLWTSIAAILLLACPLIVTIVALRERRRTDQAIDTAVSNAAAYRACCDESRKATR